MNELTDPPADSLVATIGVDDDVAVEVPQTLEQVLREPGTTVKTHKVSDTGYRVNWYRRTDTGLGFALPKIFKSAFVYFDGTNIRYAVSQ